MKGILISFIMLFIFSVLTLAEEKNNQVSIMGGSILINESGDVSEYEPGYNDFPVTPAHKSGSLGVSYARLLSSNIGLELDFKYNMGSRVTLIDPSDQERFDLDTCDNFSVTGNLIYKISSKTLQPYIAAGAGINILKAYSKEVTSSRGSIIRSVIIITPPEKTNNFTYNIGGGLIYAFNPSVGLRLDFRYMSISNIDISGFEFLGGIVFRF